MAVAHAATFTHQVNSATISITLAAPAAVGQYGVAVLSHGVTGITHTTVPAGWTLILGPISTASQTLNAYGKILTAGDIGSALTWVASAAGKQTIIVSCRSGVSASTPIGGTAIGSSDVSSASRTSPLLAANGMLIEVMSSKGADPGPWTAPAAFTVRGTVNQAGTGSVTLALGDSTTDLNGENAWSTALALSQYQAMSIWLVADTAGAGPTAVASLGQASTPPQFVTSAVAEANATGVAVIVPTNAAAGQVALAWHTYGGAPPAGGAAIVHTAPAGWVQVGATEVTASQSTALYRKTLVSGDVGASTTFTTSVTGKQVVALVVYSRVDTSNPVADVATNPVSNIASDTRTSPAMAGVQKRLIEAAVSKGGDPGAWTVPAGFTRRATINQTGLGANTLAVADSTTDLDGGNTWTLPVATASQATVWALWLTPIGGNAGAIEPYSTVTVTAAGSTPAPGKTISSYSWSWVSGGTAPTFAAVAGKPQEATFKAAGALTDVTMVVRVTVTQSDGLTSTADVSLTILYATDRLIVGSTQVPIEMQVVS